MPIFQFQLFNCNQLLIHLLSVLNGYFLSYGVQKMYFIYEMVTELSIWETGTKEKLGCSNNLMENWMLLQHVWPTFMPSPIPVLKQLFSCICVPQNPIQSSINLKGQNHRQSRGPRPHFGDPKAPVTMLWCQVPGTRYILRGLMGLGCFTGMGWQLVLMLWLIDVYTK